MEVNERIKELRVNAGLTQEELGEKLGVQKSAIAKWENGRVKNLKSKYVLAMAELFDVTPSYVMAMEPTEEEMTKVAKDAFILTEDEQKMLIEYDRLDSSKKELLLKYMELLNKAGADE